MSCLNHGKRCKGIFSEYAVITNYILLEKNGLLKCIDYDTQYSITFI